MYRLAPSHYLILLLALSLAATAVLGSGPAIAQSDTEAATLQEVVVEAERQKQPSLMDAPPKADASGQTASGMRFGPLGNLDHRDIPFSFTSYTDTAIRDRQPLAINELLRDDPSVQRETARNTYFTGIQVRGLDASYIFNGQPGVYHRDLVPTHEQFERVELYKGPNSFVTSNSPADVGGLVNLIPKRATSRETTDMTVTKLPGTALKYHLDVGKRFGKNDAFGIRVNAITEDGELNVDHVERERNSFTIALDHRGENHRITLDVENTDRTTHGAQPWFSISSGLDVPEAPELDRTYGQPWAEFDQEFQSVVLQGEYDLTDNWTVGGAWSKVNLNEFGQWQGFATVTSADGSYDWATNENWTGEPDYNTYRTYARGNAWTGGIEHNLSLNATYLNNYWNGNRGAYKTFVTSNLNDPVYIEEPSVGGKRVYPSTEDKNDLVSIGDRMVITDRLDVLAGLQWAEITALTYNNSGDVTEKVSSDALSPIGGINYDLNEQFTLYSSYAESLEPGSKAPSSAKNAGESTDPSTTRQFQVGSKFELSQLNGDVAVFRTEKESAYTNPAGIYGNHGRRRNDGVELTVNGKATPNLSVNGGVTYLDAEQVETDGGTNEGNVPIATPEYKATLYMGYEVPGYEGLAYSGSLNHTGTQYHDAANTQEVPSYTTVDIGASYDFDFDGTPMSAQLDMNNVTGEQYWTTSTIGLSPGNPRSFILSLESSF